jgi:hypothetical protein
MSGPGRVNTFLQAPGLSQLGKHLHFGWPKQ